MSGEPLVLVQRQFEKPQVYFEASITTVQWLSCYLFPQNRANQASYELPRGNITHLSPSNLHRGKESELFRAGAVADPWIRTLRMRNNDESEKELAYLFFRCQLHWHVGLLLLSKRREEEKPMRSEQVTQLLQRAKPLDQGSQGQILLVPPLRDGKTSIVKKIVKTYDNRRATNEIIAGLLLRNVPRVACLKSYYQDDDHYYLVMDHVEGKDLFRIMADQHFTPLPDRIIRRIMTQLTATLSAIHDLDVYHKDIKLENIMWDNITKTATLIDFGLCYIDRRSNECNDYGGSLPYAAPEVRMKDIDFNASLADVWSLGVVMFTLTYGVFPFNYDEDWSPNQRVHFPDRAVKSTAKDLITRMLEPEPQKRVTMAEIRKHPHLKRWLS
ncbi:hypothetical protein PROFUN_10751 [Planoprotostelium fungivorum]|uniref:Protein kinase domain-containing protein n=1 Tax=Planoprotostelium fungivorum TaxID=1890364 RepID=A0A2P6N7Y9_9EUKA|nr:hypothetical protein PROFUN_10751 [Planoprotostelium fungivorum]